MTAVRKDEPLLARQPTVTSELTSGKIALSFPPGLSLWPWCIVTPKDHDKGSPNLINMCRKEKQTIMAKMAKWFIRKFDCSQVKCKGCRRLFLYHQVKRKNKCPKCKLDNYSCRTPKTKGGSMHKLELKQKKNKRWIWELISIKGKTRKVLARSGVDFSRKAAAIQAHARLALW